MKLFWKIFTAVFISFVAVVASISYVITVKQMADAEKHLVEKNTTIGGFVSREIEHDFLESRWPFERLHQLAGRPGFLFWWVVREDGIIHQADKPAIMGTFAYDYFPQMRGKTDREGQILNRSENYGIFVTPLTLGRHKWSFWLGFSLTEIAAIKRHIILLDLFLSLGALLILGVILYFTIRHFTAPIQDLTRGTAILARGDLSHRVDIRSGDELGELADAFNKMAAALQATTDYVDNILETMLDALMVVDRDGRIITVNRAACDLLGLKKEQLLGMLLADIFSEEMLPVSKLENLLEKGKLRNYETFCRTGAGQMVPVLFSGSVMKDGAGRTVSMVCTTMDITKLKAAQEALQERERFLTSIFGSIQDGISVIDKEYNIVRVNQAMERWYAQAMPLLGKKCYEAYHGRQEPCEICPTRSTIEKGLATREVVIEKGAQGEIVRYVDLYTFPLMDESSGQIKGVVEYVRDITEQKKAEEALLESDARFRNLLEYIPGVSIQGYGTDGTVHYWNKASEEVYGYTAAEALGKNLSDLIIPADLKPLFAQGLELGAKATKSGEFLPPGELMLLNKNGSLVPVYSIHTAVCQEGRPPTMFCIDVDLSARKKAEQERLRLAKLESLGVLAGGIAHDFNNILMVMLGSISLATMASSVSEAQERLVAAEAACGQAQSLARQLLTFAKGGAPIKKPQDLKRIIKEAARLALSGSQARVEYSLPEHLWEVEVDRGQMHQVFSNLFINADQAMPTGGLIQVQAENVAESEAIRLSLPPGKYVAGTLADQGLGIAPGHLERIFDPYFTTKQKGSGIGLAAVYSIVTQHGGRITVDSHLAEGTSFHLYLPAIEGKVQDEQRLETRLPKGHGRILVMDDEPLVREVVGKMLRNLGYEPVFAHDGGKALELYATGQASGEPFDAVILDLTVPGGMGGMETIKHLLAQDPQVKAIVSSGYAGSSIMADFKSHGFLGMIAKPYRLEELGKVLQEVLNA